ncbi:MAG TPA: purine-nucleoside phosphorylase [Clostridiaceae bacterium]|nr:purine-nucleoside phosphorylase [Clostridiaceae bacterium]
MNWDNMEIYLEIASFVRNRINITPQIGIILGTSLGALADEITNPVSIPYTEIPGFLQSTAPSHAGLMISGALAGNNVICMSGRFHYYEGYSFADLALPIRLFKLLGVETVIITNISGAINTTFEPGDLMLISDHLNLMGAAPTRGINLDEFGPRFFDISKAYTPKLRELAYQSAKKLSLQLKEGVYAYVLGPHFETPAEIRALRILGADAVGMSTVPEVLTATHCGLDVLGISVISNMASGILPEDAPLSQVEEVGSSSVEKLSKLIKAIISDI